MNKKIILVLILVIFASGCTNPKTEEPTQITTQITTPTKKTFEEGEYELDLLYLEDCKKIQAKLTKAQNELDAYSKETDKTRAKLEQLINSLPK